MKAQSVLLLFLRDENVFKMIKMKTENLSFAFKDWLLRGAYLAAKWNWINADNQHTEQNANRKELEREKMYGFQAQRQYVAEMYL